MKPHYRLHVRFDQHGVRWWCTVHRPQDGRRITVGSYVLAANALAAARYVSL